MTRLGIAHRRGPLGWALATCLILVVPAFAQAPSGPPPPSPTPRRGDSGGPLQLVVDATVRSTWKDADLKRLAGAQTGPKWKNKDKEEVPSIPLWVLLKEGGISREAVKKVGVHSRSSVMATFEGTELPRIDLIVLRTGDTPNRPWRLSSLDAKDPNPYGRAVVRRIEVTTTGAAK